MYGILPLFLARYPGEFYTAALLMLPEQNKSAGHLSEEHPAQQQCDNVFLATRDGAERNLTSLARLLPHPNIITGRMRPALAAGGLIAQQINAVAGTTLYALNLLCDWLDGMSARVNKLQTQEGEKLDPIVDKITNAAYLIYLCLHHIEALAFDAAAVANIGVDLWSQSQRGPLLEQMKEGVRATVSPESCTPIDPAEKQVNNIRANTAGKLKLIVQSAAIATMLIAGDSETARHVATGMLSVAAVLGVVGTLKRKGIDVLAKLKSIKKNSRTRKHSLFTSQPSPRQ